jgi:tRNA(Ile)-lysidine synthase
VQIALPSGTLPARFRDAIENLTEGDQRPLLLAVSGGADSMAMLLLAAAAMPNRIFAATVDHGLRPEAADEARYVAGICADAQVQHSVLMPTRIISGNIQSAARVARYALLDDEATRVGARWIATAHHADDQLETLLMRIARGAGIDGLSAIRARNGRIVRPLLGFIKADLESVCANAGITPIADPSNTDPAFDRVVMRQWLAAQNHPFDVSRTARSVRGLGDASDALKWMTNRLAKERITRQFEAILLDSHDLPAELQRRLLMCALREIEPTAEPRGDAVDAALIRLKTAKTFTLGNVLCTGGETWHFRAAPPRRKVRQK